MKKRGRPSIREDVKREIFTEVQKYIEDSSKDKKPRKEFISDLRDKLKAKEWKSPLRSVPAETTIGKLFNIYNYPDSDTKDKPWSYISLSLAEQSIPADALPVVLKLWAYSLRKKGKPLTIRQATWASRLYYILKDKPPDEFLDNLWDIAVTASYHEKAVNLLEKDSYPKNREDILWYWIDDAYLYAQIVGEAMACDIVNIIQDEFSELSIVSHNMKEVQKENILKPN